MNRISANIIKDSINIDGDRITTFELVFPRFILAELNTHRVFTKNSASSRAIPFNKMVKSAMETPFIPIEFQKDHKGMQGFEYLQDMEREDAVRLWLGARNAAVQHAVKLHEAGVTKQLCNRILEPFLYHKVLLTATAFENFFKLRCPYYTTPVGGKDEFGKPFIYHSKKEVLSGHSNPINIEKLENFSTIDWLTINKGMAEIHIMDLAEKMYDSYNTSKPVKLEDGEWHIPYSDNMPEYLVEETSLLPSEKDIDFHKERTVFIVKEGEVIFTKKGTEKFNTEYFGDLTDTVRGFVIGNDVYTYINQFTPVESNEVREYFWGDYNLYAGAKDFFHYPYGVNWRLMVAVARCARLSYQTIGDNPKMDYKKDIELFNTLKESEHLSPFEHVAMATSISYLDKMSGKDLLTQGFTRRDITNVCSALTKNFRGFVQYRTLLENI